MLAIGRDYEPVEWNQFPRSLAAFRSRALRCGQIGLGRNTCAYCRESQCDNNQNFKNCHDYYSFTSNLRISAPASKLRSSILPSLVCPTKLLPSGGTL